MQHNKKIKHLKKKISLTAAVLCGALCLTIASPSPAYASSAKTLIEVTEEGQVVDIFYGVPALYIPGYKNSNTGPYSCAGYVKSFYANIYGITPTNLFTGATPNATKGTFSQIDVPRPGDIGNKSSHWFIIKEINDDGTYTVIEQNWKWMNGDTTCCYINRKVDPASDSGLRFFRWSESWPLPATEPIDENRTVSSAGHTYTLYNDVLTWQDAKAKCEALGGHLATIASEYEQSLVSSFTGNGIRPGYWLGGTDEASEGSYQWTTGETFSYANWSADRSAYGYANDYLYIGADGQWNDTAASGKAIGFICEWGPNGAPVKLSITSQPKSVSANEGDTVTFKVTAKSDGVTYQWQLSDDGGKTWRSSSVKTASYATTLSGKNNGRRVRCVVTDQYGDSVTSEAASMTLAPAKITKQPTNSAVKPGGTASFQVEASGSGLTYQWQLSDDQGKTWRNSSAKTATYAATVTDNNNGRYVRCIVTDQFGNSVKSNAAIMKFTNLAITSQPVNQTVKNGATASFKVMANGSGLTYQWQLSDDQGKTWRNSSTKTANYSAAVTDTNNGRYVRCVVTDKFGNSVKSNAAIMKLTTLKITAQPVNAKVAKGSTASFKVEATGSGLTYQWQLSDDQGKTWRNSSAKTANYAAAVTDANNGRYVRCIVTDKFGNSVKSNAAIMKIK